MKLSISIGVDEFGFTLKKSCFYKQGQPVLVCLYFKLLGDLMPAALSDRLSDTIDYETLCQKIENGISLLDCSSKEFMVEQIGHEIKNFSPLITGGYFRLSVKCHETFTTDKVLDMD